MARDPQGLSLPGQNVNSRPLNRPHGGGRLMMTSTTNNSQHKPRVVAALLSTGESWGGYQGVERRGMKGVRLCGASVVT